LQFCILSQQQGWGEEKTIEEFIASLDGKALKFANRQPSQVRSDFWLLERAFCERFALDLSARRQPAAMHRVERERVEDVTYQEVYMSAKANLVMTEKGQQGLFMETKLRGCKDKQSVYAAVDHSPDPVFQAVRNTTERSRVTADVSQVFLSTVTRDPPPLN
jgi:hypothetical protein